MPKFIHTADIHLDAPFSLFDVQKAQVRKNELRGTFSSIILLAKTEKADFVILSGDLFDSGFVTKETTSLMISQFASLPECHFIIAPGNHDFISPRSPYKKEVFPPNVHIFDTPTLSKLSFDEHGVDIYGFAFTAGTHPENPLVEKPFLDRRKINLFVGHCDLTGKSALCPLSVQDLARCGFDYAALGHIHKGGEVKRVGDTYYAYSGCPEGRSFDECGIKGVIVCELDKKEGRLSASFANRRMCRRRYEKLSVEISGTSSDAELLEKVKSAVMQEGFGADTLARIRLYGEISPEAAFSAQKLSAGALGLYYLEIRDETVPLLDTETLKNDISIRGAFFRELLPLLEGEDEEKRRLAAAALRYGLAALDGDDVADF